MASLSSGLHFQAESKEQLTSNMYGELMRIFGKELLFDIEFTKLFVQSLPQEVSIDFEDIIDVYASKARDYQLNKNLKPVEPITLEEAIEKAYRVQRELENVGLQARVVLPENKSSEDEVTSKCLAAILNGAKPDHKGKTRHRVVWLEGQSGCGKTDRVRAAVRAAGISTNPADGEFLYFSMPTLQPEDLAGLPSPDPSNPYQFIYRHYGSLSHAKVIFFDEFNRAHDKVHNAAMQLMLERAINGMQYPDVQAIFLATNPSDDAKYGGTYELDHAVIERVDHFLDVPTTANTGIIADIIGDVEVAEIGVQWYNQLSANVRNEMNPRRLTKMLQAYLSGEGLRTTVNRKISVPTNQLQDMLKKVDVLTMERLLANPAETESRMQGNSKESFDVRDRFVELCDRLYRERRARDFIKVAHLYRNIAMDKVPLPDRDRAYYNWIRRSLRKYGTDKQVAAYMKMLEDRRADKKIMKSELDAIAKELVFGTEDNTKLHTGLDKPGVTT